VSAAERDREELAERTLALRLYLASNLDVLLLGPSNPEGAYLLRQHIATVDELRDATRLASEVRT